MKHELLEGGLRIPAIMRWPGRIAAGSVSDQVMATMDWLPILLAAAGASQDKAYPADGEDLTPVLTGGAKSHSRKLYWRYKAGAQRAAREGNWKYLRIAGIEVVQDPRERANLKDREKVVFDRLKAEWEAWNATMLPERVRPANYVHSGSVTADRYGVTNPAPAAPAAPANLPKN
jgi:arylsulfatase A-like enzyme